MAMTAREWAGRKTSPHKSIERFDQMISHSQRGKRNKARNSLINQQMGTIQNENLRMPF